MTIQQLKDKVKNYVAESDLEEALNLLSKEIDEGSRHCNSVIQVKAQWSSLQHEMRNGRISFNSAQEIRNGITAAILELVRQVSADDLPDTSVPYASPGLSGGLIPVFFSRGSHFNEQQRVFIESFKAKFEMHGLKLEPVEFSFENPLLPVRRAMKEVAGCVVLALERTRAPELIEKPGSTKENRLNDVSFPTPWIQMEASMAYQQELPIIIFCEKKLKKEGMTEKGVHEFKIFEIDPDNPSELEEEYQLNVIESWSKKVREYWQVKCK